MMAELALRLRRSLTSPILIATFAYTIANQIKPKPIRSGWKFSCLPPRMGTYEGCDYNHWMIVMDIPYYLRKPQKKVEIYVQTAAKVLGSVEEAKKKIYAVSGGFCSFQVEVSEEVAQQFKGLPGVRQVLPDSYLDPENKEYGGDKYINGTIIPRPPKRGRDVIFREARLVRRPIVGNPGKKVEVVFKKKSP